MDKTCKNCRWWRDKEFCDRWSSRPELDIKKDGFDILVEVDDDSGLWMCLTTGPDFGCVHFEEKA